MLGRVASFAERLITGIEDMKASNVNVNGIHMRWLEVGDGQPVVFLHGIPTSPGLWRHVIPSIAGARRLAWEMVGYGASIPEGSHRDISVGRQADYLSAWMQVLGLEQAVLVGHDLGGGVAQITAVRYPERVRALVLMNSICYDSWPILPVKLIRNLGMGVERLPNRAFEPALRLFVQQGHDSRARADESFAEHWQHYAAGNAAAAFMRQVRALDVRDTLAVADRLPELKKSARLVWGVADRFQTIGYGYRLAHDLNARLERIEGGKHYVPEDHPERVAKAVNDLLRDLS
jgi:pimeloyl-ACP methyl ester carboxylesterase